MGKGEYRYGKQAAIVSVKMRDTFVLYSNGLDKRHSALLIVN